MLFAYSTTPATVKEVQHSWQNIDKNVFIAVLNIFENFLPHHIYCLHYETGLIHFPSRRLEQDTAQSRCFRLEDEVSYCISHMFLPRNTGQTFGRQKHLSEHYPQTVSWYGEWRCELVDD